MLVVAVDQTLQFAVLEFVMTANAVSNLGGGDRMLGAQRMYQMMNSLEPNSQSPGEMNVAGYG